MQYLTDSAADLDTAAQLLAAGLQVAIPTETVYGLAAVADQPDAVRGIFSAKGRPADHPLIVHLPQLDHLTRWASDIPPLAYTLAERFWPGPLTLVLKAAPGVSPLVNGGQSTVAVRWSSHPALQGILGRLGRAIVAPSANPFGQISPTCAAHVQQHMQGRIAAVVDGGPCTLGIESTILDLSGAQPTILRPGSISAEQLTPLLEVARRPAPDAPRVPGALASHYAPRTPCFSVSASALAGLAAALPQCAVIHHGTPLASAGWQRCLPADADGYASQLYDALHEADRSGCARILVLQPPANSAWDAVRDRLQRASQPWVDRADQPRP